MIPFTTNNRVVNHGGNLEDAILRYKIPKERWIDLSTGISPWVYPFEKLPEHVWRELPPSKTALLNSAAQYYNVNLEEIFATPGSQIAIRLIPQLLQSSRVAVPALGYQEHAASWQMASHEIISYHNTTALLELIRNHRVDHVVIINPNNPTGEILTIDAIDEIASQIKGVCIIDEAFLDHCKVSEVSSATQSSQYQNADNIIVFRSLGKFFGLAGVRLGFAIGSHPTLSTLNALLEPWSISHASQHIGIQALQDTQWQQQQHTNIKLQQETFQIVLKNYLNNHLENFTFAEAGLFNTAFAEYTALKKLHHQLAKQGIWTRLGNENKTLSWLRFGLPIDVAQFENRLSK